MARSRSGLLLAALVFSLILPTQQGYGSQTEAEETALRATMRNIFTALTTVFPLSLNAKQFQAPAQQQRIHTALQALASNASKVTAHGQKTPPHFAFLRQSLYNNAQEALYHFEQQHYDEARFIIHHFTDACFACHARLPQTRPFALGKRFLASVPQDSLSPHERLRLAIAARQFDDALATCETLFRSSQMRPAELDLLGFLEDYLRITIRVQSDFPRAIRALQAFNKRSDVPSYLSQHLGRWIEDLQETAADTKQRDAIAHARALIQEGQQHNRFLADRQGLVHFIAASGLLHRYVQDTSHSATQLAEAYYLLGVAESYTPRSSWIPETEFFLETAIRLAPTSAIAKKAYVFLEEYILVGYTGSEGLELPSDVRTDLEELRRLLQ
jgi:hypothetical protein